MTREASGATRLSITDKMMRKFKANICMIKKTNEVCPSKAKDEGDKTLVNPGAKMVGKVHEALTT